MYLIREYDVLEKEISQSFDKCKNSGATLFVRRRDVFLWIVVKYATKMAVIRCNATGKRIRKKHWNEETKAEAEQLLSEHKAPVLGKYIFFTFLAIITTVLIVSIMQQISQTKDYNASFIAKPEADKKAILSQLDSNDLIFINDAIYRIETIGDDSIIISKSNIPLTGEMGPYKEIQADLYPDSSFDKKYEVDKQGFYNSIVIINNSSHLIMQVLDR